jgi:hypothetical protein
MKDCPQKHKNVKCYNCHEMGHYQERCPVKLEQERKQKEELYEQKKLEQLNNDNLWMQENFPANDRCINNKDIINNFLRDSFNSENLFMVLTNGQQFKFKCNGRIIYGNDDVLSRRITYMTIDQFIDFLSQRGNINKIYRNIESNHINMVNILIDADVANE